MKFILAVAVLLVMSSKGTSGQYACYSCTSCASTLFSFSYDQVTCPAGGACYKEIESSGDVNRGCSDVATCGVKAILPGECKGDSGPCFICCFGDQCNGSTMATVSMATMMLSLLAAMALMRSA